jgi:CheY-specific phosphatase CheX
MNQSSSISSIDRKVGIFFAIIGKKEGNLLVTINKSDDLEKDSKDQLMNNVYSVVHHNNFYDFIINHPTVKNTVSQDGIYNFSDANYKRLVKLAKKQQVFYNENIKEFVPKKININKGYKIQKYSIDGDLLKTYNGIRDTSREEAVSDTTLKAAIANKAVYLGHRWLYLNRELPDDTIQEIGDSLTSNKQKQKMVAMLDIDRKRIVEVFTNQTTASIARKLKSSSAIYQSIAKNTLSSGHYFKYYDDCSDEMKTDFLKNGGNLPAEFNVNKGIAVKQLNAITGEVIKEYANMLEIQKQFQLSNKYIRNAIETGEVLKGFKWSL